MVMLARLVVIIVVMMAGAAWADSAMLSDTNQSWWAAIPNCELETETLNYDESTDSFLCLTDGGGGGGGDNIRVEDGDDAGTFTACTDADFEDSGDINFVRSAVPPDQISAQIRAGAVGTTEAAALDAGDTTTGTFADGRVDGSLEADELVLAGDVDGVANANDLDEAVVEVELEGVLDLLDLQDGAAADTCGGSQMVQRNSGDTAFECALEVGPQYDIWSIPGYDNCGGASQFMGTGIRSCDTTEATVDTVHSGGDVTVALMSCIQRSDSTCTTVFTFRENGADTGLTCTSTNVDACSNGTAVTLNSGDTWAIEVEDSGGTCSNSTEVVCMLHVTW